MQDIQLPTLNETIAIIISVLLGTGAYLGYMIIRKHKRIKVTTMGWILLINCFVTALCSEVLKLWNWGGYRTVFLPGIAYAGQYILDWFDKRNGKILDSAAGKVGINVKDDDNENIAETQTTDDQGTDN